MSKVLSSSSSAAAAAARSLAACHLSKETNEQNTSAQTPTHTRASISCAMLICIYRWIDR